MNTSVTMAMSTVVLEEELVSFFFGEVRPDGMEVDVNGKSLQVCNVVKRGWGGSG